MNAPPLYLAVIPLLVFEVVPGTSTYIPGTWYFEVPGIYQRAQYNLMPHVYYNFQPYHEGQMENLALPVCRWKSRIHPFVRQHTFRSYIDAPTTGAVRVSYS